MTIGEFLDAIDKVKELRKKRDNYKEIKPSHSQARKFPDALDRWESNYRIILAELEQAESVEIK
jgi:hypothetical protein